VKVVQEVADPPGEQPLGEPLLVEREAKRQRDEIVELQPPADQREVEVGQAADLLSILGPVESPSPGSSIAIP
jgi:hypothetical protein